MCAGRQQPDIISWMMGLLFIIYINAGTEAGCTRAVTMVKTHILTIVTETGIST